MVGTKSIFYVTALSGGFLLVFVCVSSWRHGIHDRFVLSVNVLVRWRSVRRSNNIFEDTEGTRC